MIKIFDNEMNEIEFDITSYQSDIFPMDNFAAFGLKMDGLYFQTSEHAFQYLKFYESSPEIAERISKAYSPNDARDIAQQNRELKPKNWLDIKYKEMEKVLRLKVEQNPVVKRKLLATGNNIIAEYCTDQDTEWGLDDNHKGENNLGKILMRIRDDII